MSDAVALKRLEETCVPHEDEEDIERLLVLDGACGGTQEGVTQ